MEKDWVGYAEVDGETGRVVAWLVINRGQLPDSHGGHSCVLLSKTLIEAGLFSYKEGAMKQRGASRIQ